MEGKKPKDWGDVPSPDNHSPYGKCIGLNEDGSQCDYDFTRQRGHVDVAGFAVTPPFPSRDPYHKHAIVFECPQCGEKCWRHASEITFEQLVDLGKIT